MFICLIVIAVLGLGILFAILGDCYWNDGLTVSGIMLIVLGIVATIICLVDIVGNHAIANLQVQENEERYEYLLEISELENSEYENLSKVDIIYLIKEWNISVNKTKYKNESPWTNWFISDKVADSCKLIE